MNERMKVCSLTTANEMKTTVAASTTRFITLRLFAAVKTRVCRGKKEEKALIWKNGQYLGCNMDKGVTFNRLILTIE